jgi:hypothetical protein
MEEPTKGRMCSTRHLKKNTNAKRYIALVNVETWLAVVDDYSVAAV